MLKLAKALGVSVKFLSDDECEDPIADIEKDDYIAEAWERYGAAGAKNMDDLFPPIPLCLRAENSLRSRRTLSLKPS